MTPLACFALGLLVGYALHVHAADREFARAARFHATGRTEQPRGQVVERVTASPEAQALRHISEDAVKNGTEMLLEVAAQEGVILSRADAERQARAMIAEANPMGGVN